MEFHLCLSLAQFFPLIKANRALERGEQRDGDRAVESRPFL